MVYKPTNIPRGAPPKAATIPSAPVPWLPAISAPSSGVPTWRWRRQASALNSGWWLTYPSEKYEGQLGWLFRIDEKNMFQTTNQKMSPTNLCLFGCWSVFKRKDLHYISLTLDDAQKMHPVIAACMRDFLNVSPNKSINKYLVYVQYIKIRHNMYKVYCKVCSQAPTSDLIYIYLPCSECIWLFSCFQHWDSWYVFPFFTIDSRHVLRTAQLQPPPCKCLGTKDLTLPGNSVRNPNRSTNSCMA